MGTTQDGNIPPPAEILEKLKAKYPQCRPNSEREGWLVAIIAELLKTYPAHKISQAFKRVYGRQIFDTATHRFVPGYLFETRQSARYLLEMAELLGCAAGNPVEFGARENRLLGRPSDPVKRKKRQKKAFERNFEKLWIL